MAALALALALLTGAGAVRYLGRPYEPPNVRSAYWDDEVKNVPTQSGRTVAITGCTSGTGLALAKGMKKRGARVLMLNRKSERAERAEKEVREVVGSEGGFVQTIECDLQSFESTRRAAEEVKKVVNENGGALDALVNNAGIMALPYEATVDGYDQQMEVNCISHFLLTAKLFSSLSKSKDARIVNHASVAANTDGEFDLNTLEKHPKCSEKFSKSHQWEMYGQTKLGNIVYTRALGEKLKEKNIKNVRAVVAHPGFAATELQVTHAKRNAGRLGNLFMNLIKLSGLLQSSEDGALGLLKCCCGKEVKSGEFWGPSNGIRNRGIPLPHEPKAKVISAYVRETFWKKCEDAIGERFVV